MTNIPLITFYVFCPQCGEKLDIKRDGESYGVELKGDRRLFCPTHGDVMSLDEGRKITFEGSRDEIVDKARNVARDLLRGAFKK